MNAELINENLVIVISLLIPLVMILFCLCIYTITKLHMLNKRYNVFTGNKRKISHNLEEQIAIYHQEAQRLEEKCNKLEDTVKDIDENLKSCIQKIGIVRYNPFEGVSGGLSYAITLLDNQDNGIVLNGIHSRTGSFTYAKHIRNGKSSHKLSPEELSSLEIAKVSGYTPLDRSKILDDLDERLPRKIEEVEYIDNDTMSLEEVIEKMTMNL